MTSPPAASRVARHTVLSLLGFIVPLAIALVAIPVAARALGPARFGLLGLAWATVEYLTFFDLGLSRATVRFVADALTRGARNLNQIVSVSLTTQIATGLFAGAALWILAPVVVALFSVPPDLTAEAIAAFRVVGANVVVVLAINALRGILEGAQRFDLSVALKIPAAAAATLVPALGALSGLDLAAILWWVFLVRLLIACGLVAAVAAAVPGFRWEQPSEWRALRKLLSYSGWLALSGALSAVLVSFDRFVLAAIGGVAAVGFYSAAYEGAVRILLIPHSMFAALFPALAASETLADRTRSAELVESALRQMAVFLAFVVTAVAVFAPDILSVWVGPEFASAAGVALRILALGVFANALAFVPIAYLYAAGRPDLPAKLHLFELVLHVPLTLLLVRRFGITGAAIAWSLRVTLDAVMLAVVVHHRGGWRVGRTERRLWRWGAGSLVVWLAALLTAANVSPLPAAFVLAIGAATAAFVAWTRALDAREQRTWRGFLKWPRLGSESRSRETADR